MKTKQIISLALMLGLSVTVINGCGTKEGSSANKKDESAYAVSSEMKEESISTTKPGAEEKNTQRICKNIFRLCRTRSSCNVV